MKSQFVLLLALVGLAFAANGNVSVSGVSAGGAFAVQFHVAYSSFVNGAGIVAGIPYWCAMDDLGIAETACMSDPDLIDLNLLIDGTKYAYGLKSIDNPLNLASSKVYIYSGTLDTVVLPGVVQKLLTYYQTFIADNGNIATEFTIESDHAMITKNFGSACSYLGEPYINNCDYDAAGAILQTIYGTLKPAVAANPDNIQTLPQAQFIPSSVFDPELLSLGSTAFLYVPTACNTTACTVHVVFHGCQQTIAQINTTYVVETGYNTWAEANNMIILYPQVQTSTLNPEGCWDWWGYTGSAYATQLGGQMATIKAMVDYVISNY